MRKAEVTAGLVGGFALGAAWLAPMTYLARLGLERELPNSVADVVHEPAVGDAAMYLAMGLVAGLVVAAMSRSGRLRTRPTMVIAVASSVPMSMVPFVTVGLLRGRTISFGP